VSGKPPDPKQKPKTGLKPALPAAPAKPKPVSSPAATLSDFDDEATQSKRVPSLSDIRRITGSIPTARNTVPMPAAPKATAPAPQPKKGTGLTARPAVLQRHLHHSGFDDEERTETSAILGHTKSLTLDEDEDDSQVSQVYDGIHAPPALTAIDTWKATIPPAQSMFGRRSKRGLLNVIQQFAAGHNPRYAPDANGQSRAHIFVWDVSRAMGCEIPHFLQGRELSLAQTVDWMKMTSHTRGWRKLLPDTALKEVEQGNLGIVVPKDKKLKTIAVLRPRSSDGVVRVAAAVPGKGNEVSVHEALGTADIELYVHD